MIMLFEIGDLLRLGNTWNSGEESNQNLQKDLPDRRKNGAGNQTK